MGTYAPAPLASHALLERASEEIFAPALAGMAAEGMPYRGTLFAGLMVSPAGDPLLLEFNVRFGDPETQVLMQTTRGDLGDALEAAARGNLAPNALASTGEHALCVVLAAANYPETPRTGDRIAGLDDAERVEGVRVYHAGTRLQDGAVVTAGGRVLGVTARGESLTTAHARAYEAVSRIRFDGMQFRTDIAARAIPGTRS
jgi:phosphoribosylamine--glycine ligase